MENESKDKGIETLLYTEHCGLDFRQLKSRYGDLILFTTNSPEPDSVNEDSIVFHPCGKSGAVLAVADGVGGSRAGHKASKSALSSLISAVDSSLARGQGLRAGILDGFEQANKNILEMGIGAATTLVVVEISENSIRSYHVGDSFVLVVGSQGKQKFQTMDHTPVGYGLESGLIAEKEAMNHDERHIVTNVLGSDYMRIEIGPVVDLAQRDTTVVGSDGLSDNLSIDEITNLVRKGALSKSAEQLIEKSHERMKMENPALPGKPDDLSFILFRPSISHPD